MCLSNRRRPSPHRSESRLPIVTLSRFPALAWAGKPVVNLQQVQIGHASRDALVSLIASPVRNPRSERFA
jgi:hypothetical protein